MNVLMARLADDQGLASARGHAPDPEWLGSLPWSAEVCELPEMVHFTLRHGSAELTDLCQQALDHLTACAEDRLWLVVEEDLFLPSEFNATEPRYQRLFALASCVLHLKDRERAMRGRHGAPILAVDPVDAHMVLIREGLHQGQLHNPVDTPQAMDVVRPQVVLHEAPILRLVLRHDAIIAVVEPRCQVDGFAPSHGLGALGSDDIHRDLQARGAVDAAPS